MNDLQQQLERHSTYLASDPANPQLLAMVIDLCLAAGEHGRAASHLAEALRLFPGDPFFLARRGTLALAERQWAAAEATFAALLTGQPDVNLAYNLAYALQWQGRHAEAYAALAPFLEQTELTPAMLTLLIRCLHHLGQGEQAISLAEAHLARCQQDPEFLAAASLVCLDGERVALAAQLSAAALALTAQQPEPAPLEALVSAGTLALAHNDEGAAVAWFEQALARYPQEGRSWSGLGTASLMRRDFSTARAQLEQAVQWMPQHIGTWHLLAWSRLFGGDLAGATAAFQSALALDRNFGESHGGLAVVQAMQGLRDEAEHSIELARRLDPEGLSAAYAAMILAGETADPLRFRTLARRLLSTRQSLLGQDLAQLLDQQQG